MGGDGGEADDEDDPEAAVAGEAGEGAVVEVGALELGGFAAEEVEEGVPGADWEGGLVSCLDIYTHTYIYIYRYIDI